MAEFCFECWNKLNGGGEREFDYVLSDDLDLCEGCGEWKRVIEYERPYKVPSLNLISLFKLIKRKK